MQNLSYVPNEANGPWATYLSQIDKVMPYLGRLGRWAETLRRPKRALCVWTSPLKWTTGALPTSRVSASSTA